MQFGLIKTVAEFPPNTKTVKQMQNILIAFLEHNLQYKGEEYRVIWLKLAHQAYLGKQKVQIIDYGAPDDVNQIIYARFENIFQEHEEVNVKLWSVLSPSLTPKNLKNILFESKNLDSQKVRKRLKF